MTMDATSRVQAIQDCEQALYRNYHALDDSDYPAVAAGFAADGVWHRQGKALQGRAAIEAELRQRPEGRVTAHIVTNVAVELLDEENAHLRYLMTAYRHDAAAAAQGPAPIGSILLVARQDDRVRRTGGRWLVVERTQRRLFA